MIRVGLTGNVASGKSAVSGFWRDAGIPVVSADELARSAVQVGSPALALIEEVFGSDVLLPEGGLDRGAMRRIVFSDAAALRRLEAIVHPVVDELRREWVEEQSRKGADLIAMEVPLLFQTGLDQSMDVVVVVDAPAAVRRQRMIETRGLSMPDAQAMMDAQPTSESLRERADLVIENDGTLSELKNRSLAALEEVRRACTPKATSPGSRNLSESSSLTTGRDLKADDDQPSRRSGGHDG